jgi:hypothetical protein
MEPVTPAGKPCIPVSKQLLAATCRWRSLETLIHIPPLMKTKSTLLLALALGFASFSTASAGLITDPLGVLSPVVGQGLITDPLSIKQPTAPVAAAMPFVSGGAHPTSANASTPWVVAPPITYPAYRPPLTADEGPLPVDVSQLGQLDVRDPQATGFVPGIIETGWIDTRYPRESHAVERPDPLLSQETLPFDAATSGQVVKAHEWLNQIVEETDGDEPIRLSDLFLNPEFFAAAHAAGPEADALRGQIDWLMLSGVILGFDGMDGSDDLFGGGGDDEVNPQTTAPASNGIILGGPGSDTIILGGAGSEPHIQPNTVQPPVNGIILGGPGSDTIILGGPGGDTVAPKPVNGFVFGTTSYLK